MIGIILFILIVGALIYFYSTGEGFKTFYNRYGSWEEIKPIVPYYSEPIVYDWTNDQGRERDIYYPWQKDPIDN